MPLAAGFVANTRTLFAVTPGLSRSRYAMTRTVAQLLAWAMPATRVASPAAAKAAAYTTRSSSCCESGGRSRCLQAHLAYCASPAASSCSASCSALRCTRSAAHLGCSWLCSLSLQCISGREEETQQQRRLMQQQGQYRCFMQQGVYVPGGSVSLYLTCCPGVEQ